MKFLSGFPKIEALPENENLDWLLLSETTQAPSENRKVTDKWSLIVFAALAVISLPFIIYTLSKSDINRLNGYDECGNICGQKNAFDPKFECSGRDYTDKPFYTYFECRVIPSWRQYDYPRDYNQQFSNFVRAIVIASFLPLVLTLLLGAGFRYVPGFTVVGLLVTSSFFLYAWYYFFKTIVIPIIFAILAVITLCVMIYARDRIRMTIILFKESAKAISNIQMLIPVPVVTLLMALNVVVMSGRSYMHMSTAGILQDTPYSHMEYVPNGLMIAAMVFNIVLTVWIIQVMLGLESMIISSAVSKWYSSRVSVTTNYCTALKRHLGSAFLGSLVISLVSPFRSILICLSQISIIKDMVDSFLRYLNGFHYSYIFTAYKGSSFSKSSKTARQLLNMKVGHATGANCLGSFVMFNCPVLVSWVSILFYFSFLENKYHLNYSQNYTAFACYFLVIISFLSCYTILAPIQVAYDTLFMCACEDILKEGHQHHSMSIKEFHSNAAEVLEKKIKGTSQSTTTPDAVVYI